MQLLMWLSQGLRGLFKSSGREISTNRDSRCQLRSAWHQLLSLEAYLCHQDSYHFVCRKLCESIFLSGHQYARLVESSAIEQNLCLYDDILSGQHDRGSADFVGRL